MPWDPVTDYRFMWENTQYFMSLWRAMKLVLCKIHGYAVAGGSDIALCADMIFMAEDAEIGYICKHVFGESDDGHVGLSAWSGKGQTRVVYG